MMIAVITYKRKRIANDTGELIDHSNIDFPKDMLPNLKAFMDNAFKNGMFWGTHYDEEGYPVGHVEYDLSQETGIQEFSFIMTGLNNVFIQSIYILETTLVLEWE